MSIRTNQKKAFIAYDEAYSGSKNLAKRTSSELFISFEGRGHKIAINHKCGGYKR